MYLGLSMALLLGSGLLAARLLGLRGFFEVGLGAVILALCEIVALSLTVGAVPGGYRPLPLLVAAGVLFLIILVTAIWRKALVGEWVRDGERGYALAMAAVVAVTLPVWIWILLNGLLLPPTYWDELYYHLVGPGAWTQAGQFYFYPSGNPFVAGYPADFGLVTGWSMVMTQSEIWADLLGLPFVLIGLAIVMTVCRRLGARPSASFWAGLLFVTTPMVIFHSKSAYIDLPMSVTAGVAMLFLWHYADQGHWRYLFAGALTMGLLVGSKFSGPYYVIFGMLPICFRMWSRELWFRRPSWRSVLALYFLPMLAIGGVWYVHNLIAFGNPLYPMKMNFFSTSLFQGYFNTDSFKFTPENGWVTLAKAILEFDPMPVMDSFHAGFGPQLLLLAIPATLVYLWRKPEQWHRALLLWLIPLLLTVAAQPAKYPRYLIQISLFLFPFLAWLLEQYSRVLKVGLYAVALGCAAYSVIIASPIYVLWPGHYDISAKSEWALRSVGPGASYYPIQRLNELKGGSLRIVAHGNIRLPYPLFGDRWQNQVLHVPPSTEQGWLADTLAVTPDIFVIDTGLAPWVSQEERQWAARHPEIFDVIFSDQVMQIYLVLPGDAAHQAFVQLVHEEAAEE